MITKEILIQDIWKTIRAISSVGVSYCHPKIQEMLHFINQLEEYPGDNLEEFFSRISE